MLDFAKRTKKMSPKTFTSFSAEEQQKVYHAIAFDIRNTTLLDKHKEPYNPKAMLMLASCKTLQGREFIGGHRIDWSKLARLFSGYTILGIQAHQHV